ncbi:PIN-like domain-containing protein [Spirosoma foliorum]|uniref:DUF4935 domain-containing protein n=1 Tax=Spirosoma foliorum TaxID=2710596 RepID=A0A7G5GYY1_9BACT|nr:PIN-like domain-containing protein [Spirosoma foliorum]QMW04073.1 DUF4935 domain-containing protein [Spirosoma foliorum]
MASSISKISFATSIKSLTLKTYVESLSRYRNGIEQAISLKDELPIFIDTSVFLRYYSISEKDRKTLFSFFSQFKDRIIITTQVQKEFVKNREDVIEKFFEDTLEKLKTSFRSDIVNKIKSYREVNKKVINDFSFLDNFLRKMSEELDKNYDSLVESVDSKKSNLNKAKYEDDLLALILGMTLIDNLSEDDIKVIKGEYENLRKGYDSKNVTNEIKKPQAAFPGLGDIKEKPENPYGDYIIYHEIINYINEKKTDAIFLTYDNTKGDWLKENKQPHDHYIQATFIATSKTLYFLDADRFFADRLNEHFDSLISEVEYEKQKIIDYERLFVQNYTQFEYYVRDLCSILKIEKYNNTSLLNLLNQLYNLGHIKYEEIRDFGILREFRNILVHYNNREVIESFSENRLVELLARLDILTNIIKGLFPKIQ